MADNSLIAVIDDDESMRLSLEGLVRSLGHAARGYASADAFLGAGDGARYACIICDITMPGMSGIELLRQLKANDIATPVILMTAFANDAVRARALQAGATCFLAKPFDAGRLIDCIARALGE